jgi:hypothetical protein
MEKSNLNNNSGTFMMGIGNGDFNSNKLIYHLKNIETELNQQIVGKSSEHLNNPKNTFNNIISKLQKQVEDLNLKVKNYNIDKKEIVDMSNKEIIRLKGIITNIYHIVKILTKSLDLTSEQKKNLLEKLRGTIEKSPGFLKSVDDIDYNITKLTQDKNKKNITMNKLLSNVDINKIALNIGESKEQIHNSTLKNLNLNNHRSNTLQKQQSNQNTLQKEQSNSNTLQKEQSNQNELNHRSNNLQKEQSNQNELNHRSNNLQKQQSNQNESYNKKVTSMNKYYENLKTHNNTLLQKKIKNKKITQNNADRLLENQLSIKS